MAQIRIGLSGWSYDEWSGGFYPTDLSPDDRLGYVAERFETVEVNGTFYGLTDPSSVRRWREATPNRFIFALKGSRYITHTKRLREPGQALANFFASGVLELGRQLGPILWQLPPNARFDPERIDGFLEMLPHDTDEAASLAREHDDRVSEASFGDGSNHRVRHVVEFRHPSFLDPKAMAIAKRHGVAVACSQSSEWPLVPDITAGFVYVRLHGPDEIYASPYGDSRLESWARRCETWRDGGMVEDLDTISELTPPSRKGRDVYVYFDNTARGHAPREAESLRRLVSE